MNYLYQVTAVKLHPILRAPAFRAFKPFILLLLLMLSSASLFAQNESRAIQSQSRAITPATVTPPPLLVREISGIVKDSTDLSIIGATVSLTSDKDTLKVSTNNDGIFIFKGVKSATYTIVVQSIGYAKTPAMRFKQNDLLPRIVMDPIIIKEESNTLNTVTIDGTPSITYKTDTVEYKASDYVVRANSTVDELLKKMEGMDVGADGTLTFQGEAVVKAKLNGKDYLGGDLTNAIKNLPYEIVDRIQIVNDYGDQAARTGIKDGDPQKILNITTRTDKSVGNMLRLNVAGGNNDRYEAGLFGTRINGNQQIGLNGNFNNTINGVAGGSGGGGGSGGTTTSENAGFSISDKVGQKIEYSVNYGFKGSDVNSLNNSYSESYIKKADSSELIASTRSNVGSNNAINHDFKAKVEINLDSNNFLSIAPSITYVSSSSLRNDSLFQTGGNHLSQKSINSSKTTRPQFGGIIFYNHLFANKRRNFSVQAEMNSNNQNAEQLQDIHTLYLGNVDEVIKDSLVNRIIARKNLQKNYRGSLTYVEPVSVNSQLELNAQINYNGYDNTATTRNINDEGFSQIIDSLSNIYDYSFTQARIALNFRYGMSSLSKIRFSAGLTAVPSVLSGTKVSLGTTTNRSSFNMIPIARFEYLWSRQHRISFNYSGNAVEPTFDQIQPVRDITNPQNPVIGNPDLKSTFVHTLRTNYNNYIANSKLNYSVNITASFTDNAVIRDSRRIDDPNVIVGPGEKQPQITETRFQNLDGVYRINGNYSINKQLSDRKYNLSLSGRVEYNHRLSMNQGQLNINTVKTYAERFGPRINPTEWFEINPNVSYDVTNSTNSSLGNDNNTNTLAFNVDGKIYFLDTWMFGYNASKNYVRGISANVTSNPFVINASVEKELFNRRGKVSVQVFDLLKQNNFVNHDVNEDGGFTDTKTNALSRYFMVRLSLNLQKWTGARGRGGRGVMRRGDGSFM